MGWSDILPHCWIWCECTLKVQNFSLKLPQIPWMDPGGQISASLPRLLQLRSRQHFKAALTLR